MQRFTRYLLIFLIVLLAMQAFGPKPVQDDGDIAFISPDEFSIGKVVTLSAINQTNEAITVGQACPNVPLKIEHFENGEWIERSASSENCTEKTVTIPADDSIAINLAPWNADLFSEKGKYRASIELEGEEKTRIFSHEFEITSPGFFRSIWRNIFYKPIFNGLIFAIDVLPTHNLGWAIILLTLVIKLVLLGPNHKALKAQKRMQKVQPQLDALKKKYANDQQRLAQESMKLWKQYKVNPMDSCLPILIQFPILIALFYVVRDGLIITDPTVLYSPLAGFDIASVETVFLGAIDLTKVNILVLPLVVALLQFSQMRLAFARNKTGGATAAGMQKAMMYTLPVMIAIFTASLPAAVGFYWGTSTLFGIGQQYMVNRSKD